MDNETNAVIPSRRGRKYMCGGEGAAGGAYGLGLIGALVYYIQHAETFQAGVIGVLKALVWPSFLVYKLLEFLKM